MLIARRAALFIAALMALRSAEGLASAQSLSELLTSATPVAERVVFANEFVVVRRVVLELLDAAPRDEASRPPVLYIRVTPGPGIVNSALLEPPPSARHSRLPGSVPVAVHIEVLKAPPPPPALGAAGTELPRGAVQDVEWEGGRLLLATFSPQHFGVGAGAFASVTSFLSDGVVDVTSRGVRRRFGVRAGDAFWFEAHTRITVVSDDPVGVAIVQLSPASRRVPRPD